MEPQTLIFEFDDVRVDKTGAQIFKSGQRVALEPKAFRVLVFLLEHPGRLVPKEELLSAIWPDTFVTENALTRAVSLLRKVLGDNTAEAKYIETVPTLGYRFVAAVTRHEASGGRTSVAEPASDDAVPQKIVPSNREESKTQTDATIYPQKTLSRIFSRQWIGAGVVILALLVALVIVFKSNREQQRALEFQSVQVTYSTALDIFPSFSPDGNTLAYASNESGSFEIYLRQLTRGGSAVALTKDGGRNLQPAWSPNGASIAYYSQAKGGIWLIPALGGVARQLTTFGSSPAWSPDGTQIVFESRGFREFSAGSYTSVHGSTLWIVSVKDGATRQLTQPNNPPDSHDSPVWSPSGEYVAFVTHALMNPSRLWTISVKTGQLTDMGSDWGLLDPVYGQDDNHFYVSAEYALWSGDAHHVANAETSARQKLFESVPEIPRYMAVSADGKKIAFSRLKTASDLYSLPMTGNSPSGTPVPLTHDTRMRKTSPSVSPDGRRVLFDVGSWDRNSGVWIIGADGQDAHPVLVPCGQPGWLSNSEDFVCSSYEKTEDPNCKSGHCGATEFWKVNVATSTRERLNHFDRVARFCSFMRDGRQAAFTSFDGGTANVWIADVAGGAAHQVTFDKEGMGFSAWSPDGNYLAVEAERGDNTEIYVMGPGGELRPLVREPGQNWPHSWSPDGSKILFASSRDGVWNIRWAAPRDLSEKQLTFYTNQNQFVRYPAWSPDGKAIVYEYAETTGNIWILEQK